MGFLSTLRELSCYGVGICCARDAYGNTLWQPHTAPPLLSHGLVTLVQTVEHLKCLAFY